MKWYNSLNKPRCVFDWINLTYNINIFSVFFLNLCFFGPSSSSVAQVMSLSPCSPAYTGTSLGSSTYLLPWRIWFQMPSLPWQQRSSLQVRAAVLEGDDLHLNGSHSADFSFADVQQAKTWEIHHTLENCGHCGRIWPLRPVYPKQNAKASDPNPDSPNSWALIPYHTRLC